jgi:hypothetical protein
MALGALLIVVALVIIERYWYRRTKAATALQLMAQALTEKQAWTVEAIKAARRAGLRV